MGVGIIGCGASGSAIANLLNRRGNINFLSIFDVDKEKLSQLKRNLTSKNNSINIEINCINAENSKKLASKFDDIDVVINAATPNLNIPIMNACLMSNIHYIDLASDPFSYPGMDKSTTLDSQLKLDTNFVNKDLLALTNLGFSPGLTDIICKYFKQKYSIKNISSISINLAEYMNSDKLVASWSPYIMILGAVNPSTVFKDGKIKEIDTFNNVSQINFPPPIGKLSMRIVSGHPELRTIPENIGIPVDYLEVRGGAKFNNLEVHDIIVAALTKKIRDNIQFSGDVIKWLASAFEPPQKFEDNVKNGSVEDESFFSKIIIKGKNDEGEVKKEYLISCKLAQIMDISPLVGATTFSVSFVPSIVAEQIVSGDIKLTGVKTATNLKETEGIIKEIRKSGLNIREK